MMQQTASVKELVVRAMTGRNVEVRGPTYSLHELTQIALAVRPGAELVILDASGMTPIERASVSTVGEGRVVFR